jgi:hypothetical protein
MSGECIESGESSWRMSGECIESGQNGENGHFGEYSNSPNWRIFGEYSNSTNSPASGHCLGKSQRMKKKKKKTFFPKINLFFSLRHLSQQLVNIFYVTTKHFLI